MTDEDKAAAVEAGLDLPGFLRRALRRAVGEVTRLTSRMPASQVGVVEQLFREALRKAGLEVHRFVATTVGTAWVEFAGASVSVSWGLSGGSMEVRRYTILVDPVLREKAEAAGQAYWRTRA